MTSTNDRPMIEDNVCFLPSERNLYVPQQLLEANELLKSINRRLEDCALEWQAEISRKQWKIFNSKVIGKNLPEQSLLARTYFTEKDLDEAFQHLLSCNKIFSEYLKNFIDLLQGEVPVSNATKEMHEVQNQSCNTTENYNASNNINMESVQLPSLDKQCLSENRKIQDYIDNILTVQNSFTDVIKAKLNFDTKFLGFEAILHKATSEPTNTICLCQFCSNIVQTAHGRKRKLRSMTINQKNRTVTKTKRLTRSTRTLSRKRRREKPSVVVGDAGDQPLVETHGNLN